ncbi:hypothetical protein APHAL10511_002327 [Amanita phalloides]|nr:hypothetical protein APHAL10511_002327 [Amanita phalloides]
MSTTKTGKASKASTKTKTAAKSARDNKAKAAKKAALQGAQSTDKRKARYSVTFHRPRTLRLPRTPKYPRKSIPHVPRMDQYRTIISPLNTESAMKKIEEHNTLVFLVDVRATKRHIQDAVKKLYEVKAAKVNTLIRPDGKKKAYVRLTADHDALDVANKCRLDLSEKVVVDSPAAPDAPFMRIYSLLILAVVSVLADHSSTNFSNARRSLSHRNIFARHRLASPFITSLLPPTSTTAPDKAASSDCADPLGLGLGCSTPTPTATTTTCSGLLDLGLDCTSSSSTPPASSTCSGLLGLGLGCSPSSSSTPTSSHSGDSGRGPPTTTSSSCSGVLGLGLGCSPPSSSTPPSQPSSSSHGKGSSPTKTPPSTSPTSSSCSGLLGLGLGCSPSSSSTHPPQSPTSSHGGSGGGSPTSSPMPTSSCSGLVGFGIGCSPLSTTTLPPQPPTSSHSGGSGGGSPTSSPTPTSSCSGLLGLGIGCSPPSSSTPPPQSPSSSHGGGSSGGPPTSSTTTTSSCSGLLGFGIGCSPLSTSTLPPQSPTSSHSGAPTTTSSCSGSLGCSTSTTSGSTSTTGSPSPSSTCGLFGLGCGPSSTSSSSSSSSSASSTTSSCGPLGCLPSSTPAPTSSNITFPMPISMTETSSTTSHVTITSTSSFITTSSSSPSINSQFTWVTMESSLAVASSIPTSAMTLTTPTTTVPLTTATNIPVNTPPLPSGIPWRIYPSSQLANGGRNIAGYTLISILFDQELNWPFVVDSPISSSQIFAWMPALITGAVGIPPDQVLTYALQVYVPIEYQGPQAASLLGTIWLGYIPTQYVSTLAAQIKRENFYIGNQALAITLQSNGGSM